jgi:uncharacterized radical SAM superfamily Fe-S cluster-containing enzyme
MASWEKRMQFLEETKSLCPSCMQTIPARIYTDGNRVFMQKKCPRHGIFQGLIWNDYQLYQKSFQFNRKISKPAEWATSVSKGCPYDCGLCPEHKQHTCLAILEVTDECNLNCPICLASSPKTSEGPRIEQIEDALKKLLKYEGEPPSIQLSGGEPTVRQDLVDIVNIANNFGFKSIEVDTNGIELAKKPKLAKELADAGLTGIYLQFDGLTADVQTLLRGSYTDLLALKNKAIERAKKAGLEVALAATIVKGVNDNQLWEIIRYAIKKDIKGVNFQPFAALGRFPSKMLNPMHKATISDVIMGIEMQSGGELKTEDFVSVPCPDNRCAVLTYTIIKNGKITPINKIVDVEKIVDYYAEPADFDEILKAASEILCGTSKNSVSCCPASIDLVKGQYFSIGCHGLQDIWNIDLNRVEKCCVHELTIEGKLVPFCLFNLTDQEGKTLYRGKKLKNFK